MKISRAREERKSKANAHVSQIFYFNRLLIMEEWENILYTLFALKYF